MLSFKDIAFLAEELQKQIMRYQNGRKYFSNIYKYDKSWII
jgi:hypothetical protein